MMRNKGEQKKGKIKFKWLIKSAIIIIIIIGSFAVNEKRNRVQAFAE
jgi:hypothetical protein